MKNNNNNKEILCKSIMPGKDSRVRRPSLNVKPTAAWWPWESPTPPQSGSEAHMKQAFPQPSQ